MRRQSLEIKRFTRCHCLSAIYLTLNLSIYVPLLKKCVDDVNNANIYPEDINLSFMFLSMQRLILVEVFHIQFS